MEMSTVTDEGFTGLGSPSLAQTFVNSIRAISAARAEEIQRINLELDEARKERDEARELLRASLDLLSAKDRAFDRLRENYFDQNARLRAVMSGTNDYEERAKIDEALEMQLVIDRYEAKRAAHRLEAA